MLIDDLDGLPFPDRQEYPQAVFHNYANFMFSRGCPYSCSYCCNSTYHRIFRGKGNMIRHRSVSKAIEEIRLFLGKYKSKMLSFDDDCFNKKPQWFREFCAEYKNNIGIPYTCNTRPELLDSETARMLKGSGCRKINIGIESGDETLRRTVLNRNMRDEQIIAAFNYAKEAGLETMSFNMIGFPGETKESIQSTVNLNKLIKPTYAQVSVFYPYAGTPLGELCREKGYIEKESSLFSYIGQGVSALNLPGLSKKEIKDMFLTFDLQISGAPGGFKKAYIAKKLKYAIFSLYSRLPYFLKDFLKHARACADAHSIL
ncbi:MAG: radical SAM protein [Candidatus Omnitrophica bacterium]|nr:radical SAM protein [Candidatus Omnitrophota bacterium]